MIFIFFERFGENVFWDCIGVVEILQDKRFSDFVTSSQDKLLQVANAIRTVSR